VELLPAAGRQSGQAIMASFTVDVRQVLDSSTVLLLLQPVPVTADAPVSRVLTVLGSHPSSHQASTTVFVQPRMSTAHAVALGAPLTRCHFSSAVFEPSQRMLALLS
jgi:hypothetical protein